MIISVISLIGLFSGIASYLITLGLSFIGLSYIIIYVGAVFIYAGLVKFQLHKEFKFFYLKKYNISNSTLYYNIKLKNTVNSVRFYYTSKKKFFFFLSDENFYEWLCGFIDGEGHFRIKKDTIRSKSPFQFEFIINLHCDDINVLYYIQKRLNIGNVNNYLTIGRFSVSSQDEIRILIGILEKYFLISSKKLDFDPPTPYYFFNKKNNRGGRVRLKKSFCNL